MNTNRKNFLVLYATALETHDELITALDGGPWDADLSLACDHLTAYLAANRAEWITAPVVYTEARPF